MTRARQICLTIALFVAAVPALPAKQDPPPAAQNPPASQDQDAAAKAAARKKRFDEMKKRLENENAEAASEAPAQTQQGSAKPVANKPAQTRPANVVFSMPVTETVGTTQRFYLFDSEAAPPNVTSSAQWTLVGDGDVAELSVIGGVPTVAYKKKGSVSLFGTFNGRSAEAQLNVIESGVGGWSQISPGDKSPLHIAPSAPQHSR